MKLGNYCILCTDQINILSNSIKVWLAFYKSGNNLALKILKQMNDTDLN